LIISLSSFHSISLPFFLRLIIAFVTTTPSLRLPDYFAAIIFVSAAAAMPLLIR